MSELRMILLAIGVVLLIGIYLYSRRKQQKSTARNTPRREPRFDAFVSESDAVPPLTRNHSTNAPLESVPETALYEQGDLELPEELRPEPQSLEVNGASEGGQADAGNEKVIIIHVSAKGGKRFSGPAIIDALKAESLEYGEYEIFHRLSGNQSVYSVASMVEPGKFDLDNIDSMTTPGLTLFLVLPGPDSPVGAFTEMLSTARRLSTALDGEVLDESGSTLSRQAASHLREQIIEFAHRIR